VTRKAVKTSGVSPKVIAGAITAIVVFALTKLAISVDPIVEQAINVLATVLAAVIAPSGNVVVEPEPQDTEGA
jgi:hypothetical protein